MTATTEGPQTISRVSPFAANESLLLQQPPLITDQDVKAVTIEEAPGQWATLTVAFDQNGVKRFSEAMRIAEREYVVLINDRIVAIYLSSDGQDTSCVRLGESFDVPDIHTVVE